MNYELKAVIDGAELLEAQDISEGNETLGPSITNVTLINSACAGVMEIGATASDQLRITIVNPHKTSFDGNTVEFYIKETDTDERSRAAEIEEMIGQGATDELIVIDRDSAEEDDEDEEEITVDEEEDAEEVDEELSAGLDTVLEGEDRESTTEEQETGEIEDQWEEVGVFYVYSQSTNTDGSITLVCYDGFCKMNGTFEPADATATIEDMFEDLTGQVLENCGILIDEEDFDEIANEIITIDFTCSYREAMGYFAGLLGGFAEFAQDGTCGISQYMFDDNNIIDSDLLYYSETSSGEMTVESVVCNQGRGTVVGEIIESGSGGQNIMFNNPFISQTILDSIFSTYQGIRFSGGEAITSWDERMRAGEFVRIFDEEEYGNYLMVRNYLEQNEGNLTEDEAKELRDGMNRLGRVILISSQTIDFRGEATTTIRSISDSESAKESQGTSQLQNALTDMNDGVNNATDIAETARTIATDTAQYFWVSNDGTDNGAHITQIPAEDFVADPNNGGGNTLINANGMAVRDGLTELGVFSAEQIRLGDFDGGNIVIVPTGFNINNAGIQFATFDTEDGIMLKTQEGADALSVIGAGELVTRTIKDVVSINARLLSNRVPITPGTRSYDTVIGTSYPTDKTLTVRTSNLYVSSGSYSNHTITYSEDEDTIVQIGNYTYSVNITFKAYIVWLTTGELVLRTQRTNSSSLVVYSDRNLFVDVSYVSYTKDVYIPKISTDGHLYLYGHSTPVGDLMTASTENYSETYSSGSSSWIYPEGNGDYSHHQAEGLLLPAGRWVVQATVRLQTLTAGSQYGVGVGYGDSRANATIALASRNVVTAGSTSAVVLNTTHLADASGSNRYYVGVYHGSKATVTYMSIKAMRVR